MIQGERQTGFTFIAFFFVLSSYTHSKTLHSREIKTKTIQTKEEKISQTNKEEGGRERMKKTKVFYKKICATRQAHDTANKEEEETSRKRKLSGM